jgi:hypothetical protein
VARLSALRIDTKKEVEGVWFTHPSGARFRVARLGNPVYQQALMKLGLRSRGGQRALNLMAEQRDVKVKRIVADIIWKDWDDLDDDPPPEGTGEKIPFSHDAAYEMFVDPELEPLYLDILTYAAEDEAFAKEAVEAAAGNSETASDGL